jgi:hypothetical protein
MANGDYVLNALRVENFDNVVTHEVDVVEGDISGFVSSTVAEKVGNQNAESERK